MTSRHPKRQSRTRCVSSRHVDQRRFKARPVAQEYARWLTALKGDIQRARTRAALAVNEELVRLYHRIGSEILARQGREGWGTRIIDRLSADLSEAFPDMKGFSSRNLKYMKVFAELCPELSIGQQAAAQLPWFHIVTLLTKVAEPEARAFYARHVVEQGWSRATLQAEIKGQLHLRQGAATTNFESTSTPRSRSLRAKHCATPTTSIFSASVMKHTSATSSPHWFVT